MSTLYNVGIEAKFHSKIDIKTLVGRNVIVEKMLIYCKAAKLN